MSDKSEGTILDQKTRLTRRKILLESTWLFARQGYHKTTVTQIARAIEMTQGALFHHFPSKEAVLVAVVERLIRGFNEYRDAMEEGSAEDKVLRVLTVMVEHHKRQPESVVCLSALASEFAGTDHPIRSKIQGAYDSFVTPFTEVLKGIPRVKNPHVAAVAFLASVQGISIQHLQNDGKPPIEDMASSFLDLIEIPHTSL